MNKRVSHTMLGLILCTALSAIGHAEGTTCGLETVIVPDGRNVQSTIPGSTTFWYIMELEAGHSYSVEIKSTVAQWGVVPGSVTQYVSDCSTVQTTNDTLFQAPEIPNTAIRYSFTAAAADQYRIKVVNGSGSSIAYNIIASDTTMYNPRWSTFSGFITQWGFQNTSNSSISGVLTVLDSVSGGPYTKNVTVPANTTVFVTTGDTFSGGPIPASHAGGARFVHLGPPGSIKADAYFINGAATVIVPSEFKSVRENSH